MFKCDCLAKGLSCGDNDLAGYENEVAVVETPQFNRWNVLLLQSRTSPDSREI